MKDNLSSKLIYIRLTRPKTPFFFFFSFSFFCVEKSAKNVR